MGVTSIGFTRAAVRKNQSPFFPERPGAASSLGDPCPGGFSSLGCLKAAPSIQEPSPAAKVLGRGRQRREGTTRFSQSLTEDARLP